MTALKPIENRRVRAVASERYPLNKVCAHPECTEPAVDPHHAFPRSAIGGDSWFVGIDYLDQPPETWPKEGLVEGILIIPHVTGLCREHHEQVERHDAWIKLDGGVWTWWDRGEDAMDPDGGFHDRFLELGALSPQPGSAEGKPKRKKRAATSEERKARKTWSVKTPAGEENIIPELMEQARAIVDEGFGEGEPVTDYIALVAVLHDYIERH